MGGCCATIHSSHTYLSVTIGRAKVDSPVLAELLRPNRRLGACCVLWCRLHPLAQLNCSFFQSCLQIYVIDSADRRRMEETGVELQQLLDEERLSHVPLLVMANKQDLLSALSPSEITTELSLNELRERTWTILPCSAKTGEGLQEAMEWLVEQINTEKKDGEAKAT